MANLNDAEIMAKRTFSKDPESEERKDAEVALREIGRTGHEIAKRQPDPENLTDVLLLHLRPQVRRQLAKRLISIALESNSEKNSLDAIREIWDRVEGKSRQTVLQARSKTDPTLKIFMEIFGEDERLVPVAEEVKYRILEADEDED